MRVGYLELGMKKLFYLFLATAFFASMASAASIGVTPGYMDQGEVEPGNTVEFEYYITASDIEQEFEVEPNYQKSLRYALGENAIIDMREVSEQDISPWIEFEQDTFTIDPTTSETYELSDGTSVNANGVVRFEVNVPPNAEPGYKIGTLELNPSIVGEGGSGAGARLVAQTVPGFAFRVSGSVERRIELAGINAVRVGENQVQIIEQLRNTGTVTNTLVKGKADILNSENQKVGTINLDSATLRPGEYAETSQLWTYEGLQGGRYTIEGQGDYRTGEMYVSGDFVITDSIEERRSIDEPSGGEVQESESAPLMLIVIVSLLVATLLYLMDIGLTWIIMLAGGTGIALFILLGPASNTLVLIPLISIGIMMYI